MEQSQIIFCVAALLAGLSYRLEKDCRYQQSIAVQWYFLTLPMMYPYVYSYICP